MNLKWTQPTRATVPEKAPLGRINGELVVTSIFYRHTKRPEILGFPAFVRCGDRI